MQDNTEPLSPASQRIFDWVLKHPQIATADNVVKHAQVSYAEVWTYVADHGDVSEDLEKLLRGLSDA